MADPAAQPTPAASGPRFVTHFVESVMFTWAGNVMRIVVGLVALRLVTGSIPESALGAYWLLTTLGALLANFADLGLGLGVVRHLPLATSRDAARRLMQTVLLLKLAVLVLLSLLIAACKSWVLELFDAGAIAETYRYLYAFIILTSLSDLYGNFLQGQSRFRIVALVAFVSSLGRLLLIVALVRGLDMGISGLFVAEVVSMLLAVLLSAALSQQGWRLRADRELGKQQLRFGFPLYLNNLLSYTASRINTVMIGGMSTTAAVSYFTVAARVPDQLSVILSSYVFVYLPNMSRLLGSDDPRQARRLLAASLRLMSFSFAMLAMGLSFFRHELLAVLAPPNYQVAAPAVPMLLSALVFSSLGLIMGNTFVALGDTRTPVYINFWTSLLSFGLNWFFIHRWGFMGAAWANFVFHVSAYTITDVVLSRRIAPEDRSYLLLLIFLAPLLVLGLRAGIALRLILLLGAAGGSLVLSPALRRDVLQVWNSRSPNLAAKLRRPLAFGRRRE